MAAITDKNVRDAFQRFVQALGGEVAAYNNPENAGKYYLDNSAHGYQAQLVLDNGGIDEVFGMAWMDTREAYRSFHFAAKALEHSRAVR